MQQATTVLPSPDSFPAHVVTKSWEAPDRSGWYAVIDLGPYVHISDPGFAAFAKSQKEAQTRCYQQIIRDARGLGHVAPHICLVPYSNLYRNLTKHWVEKEAALAH